MKSFATLIAKSCKLLLQSSPYQMFVGVPAMFLPILVFFVVFYENRSAVSNSEIHFAITMQREISWDM